MNDELEVPSKREKREERRHYSLSRARSSRLNIANNDEFEKSKAKFDYRWVNTAPDGKWSNNLADYQSIGFEAVRRRDIGMDDKIAGTPGVENTERPGDIIRKSVGSGVDSVLMRRPLEYKEKSDQEKHAEIDRREADISRNLKRGTHESTADETAYGRPDNRIARA